MVRQNKTERRSPVSGVTRATVSMKRHVNGFALNMEPSGRSAVKASIWRVTRMA